MHKHTVILSINRLYLANMEAIINTEERASFLIYFFGKSERDVRIENKKMNFIKILLNG